MNVSGEPFLNVKIKKEKITPPSTPTPPPPSSKPSTISDEDAYSLFRKIINDDPIETKRSIEPIKSSNQILAELFQVFNAPPPEVDTNLKEQSSAHHKKSKKSKKKHKKEKKADRKAKKKHKKHKKSDKHDVKIEPTSADDSSSTSDSGSDNGEKPNLKRIKSEPNDEEQTKKNGTGIPTKKRCHSKTREVVIRKEHNDSYDKEKSRNDKKSDLDKRTISKEDLTTKATTKTTTTSSTSSTHKIVIKNLSNSAVYRDTIKQVEEKLRSRRDRRSDDHDKSDGNDSVFSMSDEEIYLKDRKETHRDTKTDRFYGDEPSRRSLERDRHRRDRSGRRSRYVTFNVSN